MKKLAIVSLVFLAIFLVGCTKQSGDITLGFISPLSGDTANYGESSKGGVDVAVSEINAAGGIDGRMIKIIYEDGGCKAPTAVDAGNKLINVDKVKVILGGLCSSETLAVAPLTEAAKVILISAASSSPDITNAGDYVFRTWPSDAGQGKKAAEYAIEKGYKTVAVINPLSDYNQALAKAFTDSFTANGGEVVTHETYAQDEKDFRTPLTKIKAKNPDAIYLVSYAEGGLVAKQTRELGITVPLMASETFGAAEIVADAGEAAENVVYATMKFDETAPKTKEVLEKHKQMYGKDVSFPSFLVSAYDSVYVIADAMKKCGEDTDCIKKELYALKDYDGSAGKLTMDENGDPIKEFQLMIVKNGNFEKLE